MIRLKTVTHGVKGSCLKVTIGVHARTSYLELFMHPLHKQELYNREKK